MKSIARLWTGLKSGRYTTSIFAFAFVLVLAIAADPAYAQSNPFSTATSAAGTVRDTFKTFALTVGGIGMVSCLLLGFFGKLNWKWVATGIGVSFALAIIPATINWLAGLGGSSV